MTGAAEQVDLGLDLPVFESGKPFVGILAPSVIHDFDGDAKTTNIAQEHAARATVTEQVSFLVETIRHPFDQAVVDREGSRCQFPALATVTLSLPLPPSSQASGGGVECVAASFGQLQIRAQWREP